MLSLDQSYMDEWIYETYTYVNQNYTEHENMLAVNKTFFLCGPDQIQINETTGDFILDENGIPVPYFENITLKVIVQENVQVPISPTMVTSKRGVIQSPLLLYEQGTIYWADLNGDSTYETGFIFTEKSMEDNLAIAIYTSRSGQQKAFINAIDYAASGDELFPLY
ncbi:MAG: hypothetical protein K9W44_05550 [Candidatus Lokiarchaeota archaeon]|nr:hypothetical protein [Candidatus Harpocratesius repetitus]